MSKDTKESLYLLIYHVFISLIIGFVRFVIHIALLYEIDGDYYARKSVPFFTELMYLAIISSYVFSLYLGYRRSKIAEFNKKAFYIIYWIIFLIMISYTFWYNLVLIFGEIDCLLKDLYTYFALEANQFYPLKLNESIYTASEHSHHSAYCTVHGVSINESNK